MTLWSTLRSWLSPVAPPPPVGPVTPRSTWIPQVVQEPLVIPVLADYDSGSPLGCLEALDGHLYLSLSDGHALTPEEVTDLLGGAGWVLLDGYRDPLGAFRVRRARVVCWSTTPTTGARAPRQAPEAP